MPNINESASEKALSVRDMVEQVVMHATYPTWVCGVGRKINTGNYENIDIFGGLSLPLFVLPDDVDSIRKAVLDAANLGFELTSEETGKRYNLIKDLQRGGRPAK